MLRFLFRSLSLIFLALAVILGVIDLSRSVAASAIVMTPLADSLAASMPTFYLSMQTGTESVSPLLWTALSAVLSLPGFAFFAIAALVSYMIGRSRRRFKGFAQPV